MWILDRSQIALPRADLMFGSIAEDGQAAGARLQARLQACEAASEERPCRQCYGMGPASVPGRQLKLARVFIRDAA